MAQQQKIGILPPTVSQLSGMASTEAVRGSIAASQGSPSSGSSYTLLTNPSSHGRGTGGNDSYFQVPPNGADASLTDFTLEQALNKVQELAMENTSLREYLKDNNENMKKQFSMLSQWKERVRESNQRSLRRFEEASQQISELRMENEELNQRLAPPDAQGTIAGELQARIHKLEKEKEQTKQEAAVLQLKLDELKDQLASKSSDNEMVFVENEDVDRKLHEETQAFKLQNFHQQNEQLMQDLQNMNNLKQEVQSENTKLSTQNLELQKKVQSLLGDIKQSKHSLGGAGGEVYKTYDYSMVNSPDEEAETRSSMTAKQDMEILEMQLAAAEDLKSGEMAGRMTELGDQLQAQRKVTSQQKQKLSNQDVQISKLESQLQEKDQMLVHYKEQLQSQVAMVTKEHEQQQQELLRQLGGLNSELHQTKTSMQHNSEVQNLKSQVLHLLNESKESSARLDSTSKALDHKSARIVELEQHLYRQKEETIAMSQSLQYQLKSYEDAVGRERLEHANTKKQLSELRGSFNQLVTDYKELLDTFDEYKTQPPAQQPGAPNKQQMDDINRLTAQTIAAEEAITYRDDQIRQLKAANARLKEEIDNTVPVLQAQAEVWKQDFDAERYARERQVQEKDHILQEMKNLEVRNQQLLDEIDNYQRQSLAEMQRRHAPASHQQQMQNYLQPGLNQGSPPAFPQYPQQGSPTYPPQHEYPAQPPMEYPRREAPSPGAQNLHVTPPPTQPPSHGSSGSHTEEGDNLMTCPKCGIACPDLDTLQIHVLDCIDN